ncbi:mechanosensitive ion channel protein MscS [Methylopila jiangsuensis]|uniref:Mechanosensitive ion channel protein MscS n=1 Tax=Methylopila jiangsuensis TaxID=586230 RepID=A0A9W6N3X1_9HYPH|nr:mechanosensitive ion channel domain-containing protein [Methylopila jiangsuensis]MDR6285114.1 small conductance mechanosensitive channel [Methylopila jiangsuensis]GLK77499.1 mechanosensitive ion channel protein MscS [Methylopila jiangsuensis]
MFLRSLLTAALLTFATAASAQGPSDAPAAKADVDALIRVLEDDGARAALIERLKREAPAATAEPGPSEAVKAAGGDGPSAPPDPDAAQAAAGKAEGVAEPTFARQVAEYTRGVAEEAASVMGATAVFVSDLSSLFSAGVSGAPVDWPRVIAVLATIGVAFGVFFGLRAVGIPFYRAIGRRAASLRWPLRVPLFVASVVVDALMILIAWAVGYVFALQFGTTGVMNIQEALFLNAFLFVEMAKVALRAGLSPNHGALRLLPLSDETAAYWYFWLSRMVSALGYTFLFAAPIVTAAVSPGAAQAVRVVVAFAALLMAIAIVLQNRERVRAALAGGAEASHNDALSAFYRLLARLWHLAALAWLVALFVVWLANPDDALPFMAAATLQTAIAVAIGAAVTAFLSRLIAGGMRLPAEMKQRLPLLEARLNAFVPAVLKVMRIVVLLGVLIAIAQSWALVDFLGWVSSEVGARVATSVISAGLIVLIGLAAYLAMSSWVEYRLNPNAGAAPTARERTLLTLFRNAFTIVLAVLVVMLALSEIGVNIAPLLAGAGVLGLAVGFGAQKLVQDIITGAFIQIENAMNTGDNVKIAGVTGTVERLTIRSVGVRSIDGVYHLIPFSSVETVSNATKHFSYHMAEIGVAYRESVPEVKQAMQDAFDRLKQTAHGPAIIGPFEMHGLTVFGDSAITVRARIKTEPGKQWAAGRAYNEILKEIFDQRGIEMPYPHVTLYMGEDKNGFAPPLRIATDGDAPLVRIETPPGAETTVSAAPDRLDGPAGDGGEGSPGN